MNASKALSQVQLASAIYDYIAAGILAFPVIAAWHLGSTMLVTHELFGAVGSYPAFEPFHLLIINLFGGFTIMWSTLRIYSRQPIFGLCDGVLRWYFASLMLFYILVWSTSVMLYCFVVMEILWGSAQIWLFLAQRRQSQAVASPAFG